MINLGTPSGASLGANDEFSITIEDNDPVLSFVRSSDVTSNESGTITVIARTLSPVIADLTVPFTSFGSATLGVDYTLSANAFQFLAGASTAAVTLTIVDDAVVESSEAVTLSLQPRRTLLSAALACTRSLSATTTRLPPWVSISTASPAAKTS